MTLAKDMLDALLCSPINSIPLCLHAEPAAGSTLALLRAGVPAIAVTCTARDLIGAYVLPWHSHQAAFALKEQVNDWQGDSGCIQLTNHKGCPAAIAHWAAPLAGVGARGGHVHHPQHSGG